MSGIVVPALLMIVAQFEQERATWISAVYTPPHAESLKPEFVHPVGKVMGGKVPE
jgi:hypothetical protein